MKKKTIRLDDGFAYELRGGRVYGQVHRDRKEMDVVVDPQVIEEVKAKLSGGGQA